MKKLKVLFPILSLLLLANCASTDGISQRSIASDNSWAHCYEFDRVNGSYNNLYFYGSDTTGDIRQDNGRCVHSQTKYVGPQHFEMIDGDAKALEEKLAKAKSLDEELSVFFSGSGASSVKRIELDDKSHLLVARWNAMQKSDLLIVLKPDFKTNNVKELCRFHNHTEKVELREKNGALYVYHRLPVEGGMHGFKSYKTDDFGYKVGWRRCSSL